MVPTYVSLFAGAGGFDVGFDAAGFRCVAQVEIDKTARAVLARHWPDVPRFPDVRAFGKAQVKRCDVVVGGFPCQDVSTAGRRAGFEGGERSSLWFEMVRVVRELRPAYVVWENVPGLLSADDGRAFGWVLRELADLGFDGGWRSVDAQYFGVPQQRRRVFGVFARGRAGAERCAEVLALAEGGRRRTPKGRKAGKGVAATFTRGSGGVGVNPPGRRQEDDVNLVVGSLGATGDGGRGSRVGADEAGAGLLVVVGGGQGRERRGNTALSAKGGTGRIDFDTENFVLIQDARAGIAEKSQGGLGIRVSSVSYTLDTLATQAVCIPIDMRQASRGETMTNNRREGTSGGAPGTGVGKDGDPSPTLSVSHPPAVCVTVPVTHTLTGEGADAGEDGTGRGTPIVAFNWQSGGDCRLNAREDLTDAQSVGQVPAVAFAENSRDEVRESEIAPCLQQPGGRPGHGYPAVRIGTTVRRLTPRECERLMGWPDDWTRWRADGSEVADGPRYRLCGNGVVGTVSGWLAARLMRFGFPAATHRAAS